MSFNSCWYFTRTCSHFILFQFSFWNSNISKPNKLCLLICILFNKSWCKKPTVPCKKQNVLCKKRNVQCKKRTVPFKKRSVPCKKHTEPYHASGVVARFRVCNYLCHVALIIEIISLTKTKTRPNITQFLGITNMYLLGSLSVFHTEWCLTNVTSQLQLPAKISQHWLEDCCHVTLWPWSHHFLWLKQCYDLQKYSLS